MSKNEFTPTRLSLYVGVNSWQRHAGKYNYGAQKHKDKQKPFTALFVLFCFSFASSSKEDNDNHSKPASTGPKTNGLSKPSTQRPIQFLCLSRSWSWRQQAHLVQPLPSAIPAES